MKYGKDEFPSKQSKLSYSAGKTNIYIYIPGFLKTGSTRVLSFLRLFSF